MFSCTLRLGAAVEIHRLPQRGKAGWFQCPTHTPPHLWSCHAPRPQQPEKTVIGTPSCYANPAPQCQLCPPLALHQKAALGLDGEHPGNQGPEGCVRWGGGAQETPTSPRPLQQGRPGDLALWEAPGDFWKFCAFVKWCQRVFLLFVVIFLPGVRTEAGAGAATLRP